MSIRNVVAAFAASLALISLTACGGGGGAGTPVTGEDVAMGSADAPVTVIEYASVACPFCAEFNNTTFAAFKEKYIDTGQVRYVSREMLAHNPALAATGFLLARCAGQEKYFDVIDQIYKNQATIEQSANMRAELLKIAKANGLSEEAFDTCTTDAVAIEAINERAKGWSVNEGINATPTFVINGVVLEAAGVPTLANLDEAIAAAKAAPAPAAAPAAAAPATPAPAAAPSTGG